MPTYSAQDAADIIELEKIVIAYWRDGDFNHHKGQADFLAEDGVFQGGAQFLFEGREKVRAFYESVRAAKAGKVTTRHLINNLHVELDGDRASADFFVSSYSGVGKAPVGGVSGPVRISDGRFEFARAADGKWWVTAVRGEEIFMAAPASELAKS